MMSARLVAPLVGRCGSSRLSLLRQQTQPSPGRFLVKTVRNTVSSHCYSTETESAAPSSSIITHLPPILPPPSESCPSALPSGGSMASGSDGSDGSDGANPQRQKSFFDRLWDRYSISGQQHRILTAEALFQAATRQASDPRWFGPGRIGRDFRPRHALLTMHIWFLHKRLISDQIDKHLALLIQEELFNILWDDTTSRIRQAGVNELLVNKSLMQVQQYTFLHLTHYDHCFTEFLSKPAERLNELRKVAWMHLLVRDEEAEHRRDHLDRLAWYVEANYQNVVMDWPDPYYRQARVAWVDLPDFSDLRGADGAVLPDHPVDPRDVLPPPWLRNITRSGVEYYWNPVTRQSTRQRPV